jgi:predicted transcriptional regulator
MAEAADILISVEERHVNSMKSGAKTVELRRRPINVSSGCRVWIYSKIPRGHVDAVGIVDRVASGTPNYIWSAYGKKCGISKKEFDKYFSGCRKCYVIVFQAITWLCKSFGLNEIRRIYSKFQPPQFFKRLEKGCPELKLFETAFELELAELPTTRAIVRRKSGMLTRIKGGRHA